MQLNFANIVSILILVIVLVMSIHQFFYQDPAADVTFENRRAQDSLQQVIRERDVEISRIDSTYRSYHQSDSITIDSLKNISSSLKVSMTKIEKDYQDKIKKLLAKPITVQDSIDVHRWLRQ